MSLETSIWRNTKFLVGQTAQRGHAWHYRASDQGVEPNHYDGFIPVGDVVRRLFPSPVLTVPTAIAIPVGPGEVPDFMQNDIGYRWQLMARKGIIPGTPEERLDLIDVETGHFDPLGIHGLDYVSHQYADWLIDRIGTLLDVSNGELGISSAILMRGGRVASVELSLPDTIVTPAGFPFRPNVLAYTSHNGDYATTWKRTVTAVVCDNTFRAADREDERGGIQRWRHTAASADDVTTMMDARKALGIIIKGGEAAGAKIEAMAAHKVSEAEWGRVLDVLAPKAADDATPRSKGFVERKRGALTLLWTDDERVAPWRGSALGVVQAFSTYTHHVQRGTADPDKRGERAAWRTVNGAYAQVEAEVLEALATAQK
jgi:phage/plasmid-like protein (TIGR03299 family)